MKLRHQAARTRCVGLSALALAACASLNSASPTIDGVVAINGPLAAATVTAIGANGQQIQARTDDQGRYHINANGLTAPILLSAIEAGDNTNCRYNARLRARCLASVLTELGAGENVANINPLSDRIVSDVAVQLKFIGPQQLVDAGAAALIRPEAVATAKHTAMAGFADALKAAGVADIAHFDAITTPMHRDGGALGEVLEVVNHNRNYDNPTSESAHAVLTDISFRPIVGLTGSGPYEPLDFTRARAELAAIRSARTRVLIVGDSTAATYEQERLPRMGWGQVFEQQFRPDAGVKVLNGARSGRSSKDFYMGGWYQQMARFLQPGDLVLINHGHNDQNCDSAKPARGPADVAGLCTYPDDAAGNLQYPDGKPEMSFRVSLLRYVELARAQGATPVLLTPTTRVWGQDRKPGFPVVPQHLTSQNSAKGFAFVGHYSETVKNAARISNTPLIDLEAASIAFANAHQKDWKQYWLAVEDFARYPYYATQTSGTFEKPDTTHFQQRGAEAMAAMVASGIRETPSLRNYADKLY